MSLSTLKLWWFVVPAMVIVIIYVGSTRYQFSRYRKALVKTMSRKEMRKYAIISSIIIGTLLYFESFEEIKEFLFTHTQADHNQPQLSVILAIIFICLFVQEILYVICGLSGRNMKRRLRRRLEMHD